MSLIIWKVKLELRQTKYCVSSVVDNNDDDASPNIIIFTISNTKLCIPVVTLLAIDILKLSKPLNKGFGRSLY